MENVKLYSKIKGIGFATDNINTHQIHIVMSSDPINLDINKINFNLDKVNIKDVKEPLINEKETISYINKTFIKLNCYIKKMFNN